MILIMYCKYLYFLYKINQNYFLESENDSYLETKRVCFNHIICIHLEGERVSMRAFPTSSSDLAGMFKRIERTMWLVCHLKWVKCLQILQHHSKPPRKQQLPQFLLILKVYLKASFALVWWKRRIKLKKSRSDCK